MPCPPGTPLHCCGNPLASWLLPIASHAFKRNFTAGSSRVYCTTCCVHWLLPLRAPLSTCHGYGNSLLRFDSQQVEGPALELGWLGGNGGRVPRPPPARPACPAGPVPRPGRHTGTAVEPAAAACAIPRNRPACTGRHGRAHGSRCRRGSGGSAGDPCSCGRRVPRPRDSCTPPRQPRPLGRAGWCEWHTGRRAGPRAGGVDEGLLADALALAPGLAEQDGGFVGAVGDNFDVEGNGRGLWEHYRQCIRS